MVRQAHHERVGQRERVSGFAQAPAHYAGQWRLNQGNPSNRRSGESRNPGNPPGKERAGYRGFWIPAFAGTTVLFCDCLGSPGAGWAACWCLWYHYLRVKGGLQTRPYRDSTRPGPVRNQPRPFWPFHLRVKGRVETRPYRDLTRPGPVRNRPRRFWPFPIYGGLRPG